MKRRPRVAVVGYGAIGRHHARNLAAMESVQLLGIVDPSPETLKDAAALGYRCYGDISGALAAGIDAAVISVPTHLHHGVAIELLNAGVALLVEKPIASNLDQAMEMIQLARQKTLPLMVGYVERFNPAVIAAQQLMADGLIGTPLHISTRRVGAMPPRIKDANVIVDIGVHDIDIISFLLQSEPRLISAQGGMAAINDRVDYATIALDASGVIATATINWVTPVKIRDMTITGTNGYLHVDYLTQQTYFAPGRNFVVTESYEDFVAQYEDGKLLEWPIEKSEPLRLQLNKFVDALNGGELPDPRIAMQSLRIALEATDQIESNLCIGVAS